LAHEPATILRPIARMEADPGQHGLRSRG